MFFDLSRGNGLRTLHMHAAPIFMTDYDFGSDLCRTRDPAQINHMQFFPQFMVLNGPTNGMGKNPTLSGKPPALCIGSVGDCQGVKAYREILWLVKSLGQIFWVSKKHVFRDVVTFLNASA